MTKADNRSLEISEPLMEIEREAKRHIIALGSIPDPALPHFLQLAGLGLTLYPDRYPPRNRCAIATHLERLQGLTAGQALNWLFEEDEGFDFSADPEIAASEALDQIDSRMSAEIDG
jgi:hypothetical protein